MSRIYDAIKRAQSERTTEGKSVEKNGFERRRAERRELRVPVFVYGHGSRREPFHEETTSLIVNSHGALLVLSNEVKSGQELLLTNSATRREQACRVVHMVRKRSKHHIVAVAFVTAAPMFWSSTEKSAAEPATLAPILPDAS